MKAEYAKTRSVVTITYIDGEVKDYEMSASPHIIHYLATEAASTGMFIIRDDDDQTSTLIPMDQVRSMGIRKQEGEDDGD